jgi:hypothetical protein
LEVFEFGSVTYCTNVPAGEHPSDDEAEYVASQVAEIFGSRLAESNFAADISVVRDTYGVGCIFTTIALGATATALYKFVKDYPKFRRSVPLMLEDLNGICVRLKGSAKKGSTYIMRDDLPDENALAAIAKESKTGTRKAAKIDKRPVRQSPRRER